LKIIKTLISLFPFPHEGEFNNDLHTDNINSCTKFRTNFYMNLHHCQQYYENNIIRRKRERSIWTISEDNSIKRFDQIHLSWKRITTLSVLSRGI